MLVIPLLRQEQDSGLVIMSSYPRTFLCSKIG